LLFNGLFIFSFIRVFQEQDPYEGEVKMDEHKEIERTERKSDSSQVASTFIKYAAYLIIFFGILWFIISYLIPMIRG